MLFKNLIFWGLLALPVLLLSQSDSTDISSYFDEGGVDGHSLIIKYNYLNAANGEFPVTVEYIRGNSLGIEAGVGLILPSYSSNLILERADESEVVDPELSYSIWVQPKYFFGDNPVASTFAGILYKHKVFNESSGVTNRFNEASAVFGLQAALSGVISYEFFVGAGYRFPNDVLSDKFFSRFLLPMGAKIGFVIF
ncbi:MAG: hypothetical protein AAGI38_09410 [Bacteroidota bacterium]